jgi:hypothetical protein
MFLLLEKSLLKQNTAEIWKIAAVQLPLYLPVTLRKALG